ncbi:MAG: tRNA (N6-threonylcarbamoyladenosine(37)-N6)-methyltransferase TrmO [Bacteroidota bacterium]
MKIEDITITPIGIIHTKFTVKEKIPRQGRYSEDSESYLELNSKFKSGLLDLDSFSHAILVFHFHKSNDYELIQRPKRDNKPHGVFAIRSPLRPSGIGITTVKLISVKGRIVKFYGADMINGTPLLDIKPYIPDIDSYPDASNGWLANIAK